MNITFVSASSELLLSASPINVLRNVITVVLPSSDRTSFVARKLFRIYAFFITKYPKIRVINFYIFSPFDKNSLKSQLSWWCDDVIRPPLTITVLHLNRYRPVSVNDYINSVVTSRNVLYYTPCQVLVCWCPRNVVLNKAIQYRIYAKTLLVSGMVVMFSLIILSFMICSKSLFLVPLFNPSEVAILSLIHLQ